MKTRGIAILLVLAVLALALCVVVARKSASEFKAAPTGAPFAKVAINDSAKILVRDASGECAVEKLGEIWTVPEKSGYPADFSKIKELLEGLVELKPSQRIPGGAACLDRFDLLPPAKGAAKSGLEIQVISKDGKELVEIVKGKPFKNDDPDDGNQMAMMMGRKSEGSRFAYLPKEKEVVVISNPLSQASTRASDWLDKAFVKISDLKSISLGEGGKDVWTLSRESATADWKLEGAIPENMEFDKQAASSLASSLSWTTFSDVAGKLDKAKPQFGLAKPRVATCESFDGFVYKFDVGEEKDGKYFATLSVDYKPAPFVAKKDLKPEELKKEQAEYDKKVSEGKEKLSKWTKLVDGWVYGFDKYAFEKLVGPKDKLLMKKPEEKKPETAKPDAKAVDVNSAAPVKN